jgi:hypothetical protein
MSLLPGTSPLTETQPPDYLPGQSDGADSTGESSGSADGGNYDFADLPAPRGGQGLPRSYWQQPENLGSWLTYRPDQSFNAVFGVEAPGDPTLLQVLRTTGRGPAALDRQAVAALLNAASAAVAYRYSVDQVIRLVQKAYDTGDFETPARLLAGQNNEGVPIRPSTGTLSGFVRGGGFPLGNVVLSLSTKDGHGQTVIVYAMTDHNGFYKFAGLPPATYLLTVFPPRADGSPDTPGTIADVRVPAGNLGLNYDFTDSPVPAGR